MVTSFLLSSCTTIFIPSRRPTSLPRFPSTGREEMTSGIISTKSCVQILGGPSSLSSTSYNNCHPSHSSNSPNMQVAEIDKTGRVVLRPILSRTTTISVRYAGSKSSFLGSADAGEGKEGRSGLIQTRVIGFLFSWTYFTYSAVLLLSETSPSLFCLRSATQVQAMKNAIGVNKKGVYRLEIHMKDGTLYKFKLPEEDN